MNGDAFKGGCGQQKLTEQGAEYGDDEQVQRCHVSGRLLRSLFKVVAGHSLEEPRWSTTTQLRKEATPSFGRVAQVARWRAS